MNEKEFLKPFRIFELEIKRLKRWYLASLYSYDITANSLDTSVPYLEENKFFYKDTYFLDQHPSHLKKKFEDRFTTFLEEMTLIRLISLLEIFLLDVLRTSFYHDKTCFYVNKERIDFSLSEFLSKDMESLEKKYIEDKISNLHRQGFKEVQKFYSQRFSIDFNNFNVNIEGEKHNLKYVNKIHDTRHLIVHSLGLTDDKFKRDYDCTYKKIKLDEEMVLLYLNIISNFVDFIKMQCLNKWFVTSLDR